MAEGQRIANSTTDAAQKAPELPLAVGSGTLHLRGGYSKNSFHRGVSFGSGALPRLGLSFASYGPLSAAFLDSQSY